jgi:hypothetical protein
MICCHTTDAADAIGHHGFRDATGSYMFVNFELAGVWLGDSPVDINEGAKGDQVLRVEFPDGVDLGDVELNGFASTAGLPIGLDQVPGRAGGPPR